MLLNDYSIDGVHMKLRHEAAAFTLTIRIIYILIHVPYMITGYYICTVHGLRVNMCIHRILLCSSSLKLLSGDI